MKIKLQWIVITLSALIAFLTGCSSQMGHAKVDPYEGFNRWSYAFNTDLDHLILRPVSTVYNNATPPQFRTGVSHFFDNITILTTLPNDFLQGKGKYVVEDFWRFLINSTLGIGGLFDVATQMGLPRHYNDFGMTLAYYGHEPSPYLVIPVLGPSTFRDGFGLLLGYVASPWPYVRPYWASWTALGLKLTSMRASLMPANKLLDEAFDPYIMMRNAYLQNRDALIAANNADSMQQADQIASHDLSDVSQTSSSNTNTEDADTNTAGSQLN